MIEDWKKVIWSDECSIWVEVNPRWQWVIHPPGERLDQKYIKKTFKSAYVKVMVWTYFSGNRLYSMVVYNERRIGVMNMKIFYMIDDSLLSMAFYNQWKWIQFISQILTHFSLCKTMHHVIKQTVSLNSL